MRVLIADDHWSVRDGLHWMLDGVDDIEVVGEAASGRDLLAIIEDVSPDVVLLDINMPEMSGLEVLAELRSVAPSVKVIILSMYDRTAYVKRAIELGASGYLLKSAGRDELVRALRAVSSGQGYIQGEVAGPLMTASESEGDSAARLSPRELEVLQLVAGGMENKQVARHLRISEATVKSYLQSAYERLGVRSRAEAVAVAFREGLIE